ncbi:MAG: hypothetical protein EBE86_030810 [Hormoscilla sp. GUM202]|nr:hypothetical protein [Hormoscilla sp. GUM202]
MAKLSPETTATVNRLKDRLLEIVDEATAAEFALFARFGETDRTIIVLDELKNVSQEAASRFSQLSNFQIRIAESQPVVASDMLEILGQAIVRTQNRIPAWERSIEEVKIDWNMP